MSSICRAVDGGELRSGCANCFDLSTVSSQREPFGAAGRFGAGSPGLLGRRRLRVPDRLGGVDSRSSVSQQQRMPWIVGVSGASGTPFAAAVLRGLLAAGECVDLV